MRKKDNSRRIGFSGLFCGRTFAGKESKTRTIEGRKKAVGKRLKSALRPPRAE
jgi:hypothetical protein